METPLDVLLEPEDSDPQAPVKRTYVQRSADDKTAILDFASSWYDNNPGGSKKQLCRALLETYGVANSSARRILKSESVGTQTKTRGRRRLMSDNTQAALRLWADRTAVGAQAVPISQELYRVKVCIGKLIISFLKESTYFFRLRNP
jgi:hypothetical protein